MKNEARVPPEDKGLGGRFFVKESRVCAPVLRHTFEYISSAAAPRRNSEYTYVCAYRVRRSENFRFENLNVVTESVTAELM